MLCRKKSALRALVLAEEEALYETALRTLGFFVTTTQNLSEGQALTQKHLPDLILFDARMIDIEKACELRKIHDSALLICLAPDHLLPQAISAVEEKKTWGYLALPFCLETLEILLNKAAKQLGSAHAKTEKVIAESSWMKKFLQDVEYIAKSHSSIFLHGESGTGKEMIAGVIHSHSPRASFPFIKVNCAAIPATLLESEFFGHEKGAFTGAIQKKLGRFELAHQGTLLLDEISEISLDLQPKLLRAIQEMEFERVGGTRPVQVNVRLISTSNRSMKELLDQKLFREDLFYRLNVVPISIPPLREHKEDILPLAEYFLTKLSSEHALPIKTLSAEAKAFLLDYHWPGNIRELANVIERALVMHTSQVISQEHFQIDPTSHPKTSPSFEEGLTLKEMEKQLILQTLQKHQSNRSQTAKALGISIRTLRNKLNSYKS